MPSINAAYNWAINTCNDAHVGYPDLNTHPEWRNQVTVDGITYYDCSSFIWFALKAGGFDVVAANGGVDYPFVTGTMDGVLTRLGFHTVPLNSQLLPGDIGVHNRGSYGGHTEMCYRGGAGQGIFMGAHGHFRPLAEQVSINTYITYGSNWEKIYRYQGGASGEEVSNYVIAAMCGNFFQESGVNPGIWESLVERNWDSMYYQNTGGYGLGQWTNTSSDSMRLLNLHNWVTSNGYSDGDGYGQLAFLIHENVWMKNSVETSAYNNLTEFLTSNSTDIDALTKEYFFHWEGINNGTLSQRQQFAHQAYDYIVAHYNDTNINTWVSGNRYISQSDALNNCVLIARFLSTGYAPYQVKMKIWLAKRHWIRKRRMKM